MTKEQLLHCPHCGLQTNEYVATDILGHLYTCTSCLGKFAVPSDTVMRETSNDRAHANLELFQA